MKRVIKPFWSYNISKTEDWLSKMAKEGYILKDINIFKSYLNANKKVEIN